MGAVVIIIMMLLFLLSTPIAASIGFTSFLYMLFTNVNLQMIPQRLFTTIDVSTLFAIPLFLLSGLLMNTSGITDRIFKFANVLVGHVSGGLAHVNVLASTIFASMSGSSVADAAGLGSIEIKAMTDAGYDKEFSCAVTLASCTISPIIPPSIIMVIYGVTANVSIGRLFLGGIIPGLMMAASLMLVNTFIVKKRKYPLMPKSSFKEIVTAFRRALLPLGTPIIIIGGIIGGIFTATEAAAVSVLYTLVLDLFIYKEITFKKFIELLEEVGKTSALILFLVATTGILGWVLARERIPIQVMDLILSLTNNPIIIMLLVNIFILILGCFIDATPIVLLMVPILMPLLQKINFDPVHFGIIISINTMIGLTTPPVGVSLYAVSAVSGVPIQGIIKEIIPYWIVLIVLLIVLSYFPALSVTLPTLVFGKGG